MKKILFPTEFSGHSPEVFHYALELARRFKATLTVMHVFGKPNPANQKSVESMTDHIMDILVDFVEKNRPEGYENVELEYIVDVGSPAEAIVNVALDETVDLIVMGMTGKTNALEKVFGSVSTEVLANADAPVLLVPAHWKYRWFHKIVYASDFAFRDIGALNYLKKLAKVFNSEIDVLHVVEKGEDDMKAEVNMKILKDTFNEKCFSEFDVLRGDLVKEINDYLDEENAGMVVMLSRKRGMMEKIRERGRTREMAQKLRMPLLVFKENAYENVGWKIDLTSLIPV